MACPILPCSMPVLLGAQKSVFCKELKPALVEGVKIARQKNRACLATLRTYQPKHKPLVKICGVTCVEDAELAAKAGADFVGMILWPKARRAVSLQKASQIAATARKNGANPVAVFVDEDFADIVRICKQTGIFVAQLHGKGSRGALQDLPNWLEVIFVLHARPDGSIQTQDPHTLLGSKACIRQVDWLLIDGLKGGSGEAYDWKRLEAPQLADGMKGWLLAGGLNSENVREAVLASKATGVDVSSGVAGPDGLIKDPNKVFTFIEEVRRASVEAERASET